MKGTPNPFDLPPVERARCSHPERHMHPNGRYSICPECFLEGLRKALRENPIAAVGLVGRGGPFPEA